MDSGNIANDEKSRSRSRVSVGQIAIGTPGFAFKSKLTGAMAPNSQSNQAAAGGLANINLLNVNNTGFTGTATSTTLNNNATESNSNREAGMLKNSHLQ